MDYEKNAVEHVVQVNVSVGVSVQTDPCMSVNLSEWLHKWG